MSRILRRPMFRGGPVDSRGTGITSGLGYENGGRVGYQNAGFVTGQQIIDANRNNPFFQTNTLNPRSRFTLGQSRGGLDNLIRATMFDTEQFPLVGKETGLSKTASLTDLYEAQTDDDAEGLLASVNLTDLPRVKTKAKASEGEIEIEEKDDDPKTEIIDNSPTTVPTPKGDDDEPEVTMTDLEKALGLDRARQEYAADALAAASKAFFEGKGFGAIADAAAVKSKAPDIKRLAGLEEFKAKKAAELFKLKDKKKQFAPGNVQKTVDYLVGQGMDKDEAIKRATKQSGTFAEELSKNSVGGTILSQGFALAAETFYGDSYKGDVTAVKVINADKSTSLPDGIYSDKDNKLIFEVKDKKVVFDRSYS